jgi:hypothetical protein
MLALSDLERLIQMLLDTGDETGVLLAFRDWVRSSLDKA